MITLNPRQEALVQFARDHGYVTVDDLVTRLSVTHQTVRRDINFLCDHGVLSRFHGGAAYRSSVANLPYEARQDSLSDEKAAIAELVTAEIPDRSSVFLDIGTTAEAVARRLMDRSGLRIITNNINVVTQLSKKEDFEILICPGALRNRDLAIVGSSTTEFVRRFKVDFAVLGIVAVDEDGNILDFSVDEIELTQAVIGCGRQVFVVADHSKFGRNALVKVAHLSQVSALFSDAAPRQPWRKLLSDAGVRVVSPKVGL